MSDVNNGLNSGFIVAIVTAIGGLATTVGGVVITYVRMKKQLKTEDIDDAIRRHMTINDAVQKQMDVQQARHVDSQERKDREHKEAMDRKDKEHKEDVETLFKRIDKLEGNVASQSSLVNQLADEHADCRTQLDVLYVATQAIYKSYVILAKKSGIDPSDLPDMPSRPQTTSAEFRRRTSAQNTVLALDKHADLKDTAGS